MPNTETTRSALIERNRRIETSYICFFGYKNPARLHTAEMRERQPDTYETGNAAIVAKRTILSIFTKKHIRLVGSMDTALTV